jgi:hypothetical protein
MVVTLLNPEKSFRECQKRKNKPQISQITQMMKSKSFRRLPTRRAAVDKTTRRKTPHPNLCNLRNLWFNFLPSHF